MRLWFPPPNIPMPLPPCRPYRQRSMYIARSHLPVMCMSVGSLPRLPPRQAYRPKWGPRFMPVTISDGWSNSFSQAPSERSAKPILGSAGRGDGKALPTTPPRKSIPCLSFWIGTCGSGPLPTVPSTMSIFRDRNGIAGGILGTVPCRIWVVIEMIFPGGHLNWMHR